MRKKEHPRLTLGVDFALEKSWQWEDITILTARADEDDTTTWLRAWQDQREEEAEVPAGSRAMTASMLARALSAAGEFGQSVGAHGYASELFGQAEEHADQAMSMTEQAKILARFDELGEKLDGGGKNGSGWRNCGKRSG